MEMDVLKMILIVVLYGKGTLSKESKFCRSHVLLGIPNYCGNEYAECSPGYVINVVEVEKGDKSTCIGCKCCDETSFNAEWTDLMKDHCNGRGKCKTSNVNDVEDRVAKTVYKCITEHHSTTSSVNTMFTVHIDNQTSTKLFSTFESNIPSSVTSKPTGPSLLTTNAETQQSSSSTTSHKRQNPSEIPNEEDMFPVAVAVAIPTVALVIIIVVIVMVFVCRKRKLNKPENVNQSNEVSRGITGDQDEKRLSLQLGEINQYANCAQPGDRVQPGASDDSFATGQVETHYEHLGRNSETYENQPEHVYTVANYRGNDPENDNYYNIANH